MLQEVAQGEGPLHGVRVLEMAGLGPVTFAGMLLADMGAEVVRVSRPGHAEMEKGATLRGRTQVTLDLRAQKDRQLALDLASNADILIEGFRPGVMERLGLGPEVALSSNTKLVYGRMTGWGQTGPRSSTAGHDIDYIAITGALHAIGGQEPSVPLNLVGDYGGGALYLAMGVLAGLLQARSSGHGQVIDCAICDGSLSLMSLVYGLRHSGRWSDQRHANTLDGAAPFYRTYRCADDRFVAVGAIEPAFYRQLLKLLEVDSPLFEQQNNRGLWTAQSQALQAIFAKRTRDEWIRIFDGTDACVAPVNSLSESLEDAHLKARGCLVELAGEIQPAPAPRFAAGLSQPRPSQERQAHDVLATWCVSADMARRIGEM